MEKVCWMKVKLGHKIDLRRVLVHRKILQTCWKTDKVINSFANFQAQSKPCRFCSQVHRNVNQSKDVLREERTRRLWFTEQHGLKSTINREQQIDPPGADGLHLSSYRLVNCCTRKLQCFDDRVRRAQTKCGAFNAPGILWGKQVIEFVNRRSLRV